jgi:C4-dicarboxylate-specific signal transduction histidine kinase
MALHDHDNAKRRDAITAMGDTILARMDRYFQIQHWMQAWLDELRHERELRRRTHALSKRVARLESAVGLTRDPATHEIAEIRLEVFELRYEACQTDYLRRQLAALTQRVDGLDPRRQL